MTRRVEFTQPAQSQFLSALAYIKADRPSAAGDFRDRAAKVLANLTKFPDSGRMIPEFPNLVFREVLVDSYRFFYKPVGDVIWVVGAWHDAQIPDEPSDPSGV